MYPKKEIIWDLAALNDGKTSFFQLTVQLSTVHICHNQRCCTLSPKANVVMKWSDNTQFHVTNTPSQMLKTPSAPSKYRNTQTKTPSLPNINLCCFVQGNFRGQFTRFYDVKFTGLKTQWRTKVTNMSYATDKYTHNCNWKGS